MFRRLHGTLTKKEHPDIQFMQGKITNAEEIEYLNGKEEDLLERQFSSCHIIV